MIRRTMRLVAAALMAALAISACGCLGRKTPPDPVAQPENPPQNIGAGVQISIYLARWKDSPRLEAVGRIVVPKEGAGEAELIKTAVESLIAGPTETEKSSGLSGTLPKSTTVRSVKVDGTIATIDFSKEIITKASAEAAVSGTGESLALESVRKTVAGVVGGSSKIEKVKIMIEGKSKGQVDGRLVEDFWGHVGLPEYLLLKGEGETEPKAGGPAEQSVGKPADGMAIKSVRWSSDASKFRFVIDIENADGTAAAHCPAVKASLSASSRVISIDVNGIRAVKEARLVAGKPLKISAGCARTVTRIADESRGDDQCVTLALALDPAKSYTYKMFSLSKPVRVVIDVFPK